MSLDVVVPLFRGLQFSDKIERRPLSMHRYQISFSVVQVETLLFKLITKRFTLRSVGRSYSEPFNNFYGYTPGAEPK